MLFPCLTWGSLSFNFLKAALHKWLVAMVATWMDDHESNHAIFTLIGPQGIYKTPFFRHLLPPPLHAYFWENASMIALLIGGGHIGNTISIRKVSHIMKKLKFTTVHKNTGDYFRVVVIPYEQQQFYIENDQDDKSFNTTSSQTADYEQLDLPL